MDKMRCQTSTCTKSSYSEDYGANGVNVTLAEVKLTKNSFSENSCGESYLFRDSKSRVMHLQFKPLATVFR